MGLSAEQAVAMARADLDQCETLLRESFASLGVAQATVLEEFRNRLDGDTLDDIGTVAYSAAMVSLKQHILAALAKCSEPEVGTPTAMAVRNIALRKAVVALLDANEKFRTLPHGSGDLAREYVANAERYARAILAIGR